MPGRAGWGWRPMMTAMERSGWTAQLVDLARRQLPPADPRHAITPPPFSKGERAYGGTIFKSPRPFRRLVGSGAAYRQPRSRRGPWKRDRGRPRGGGSPRRKRGSATPYCPRHRLARRGRRKIWASQFRARIRSGLAVATWEWGRLLRRRQDEGRGSLDIAKWKSPAPNPSPATPGSPPGLLHDLHHVETCRRGEGLSDAMMFDYRGLCSPRRPGPTSSFVKDGGGAIPLWPTGFLNGITRPDRDRDAGRAADPRAPRPYRGLRA